MFSRGKISLRQEAPPAISDGGEISSQAAVGIRGDVCWLLELLLGGTKMIASSLSSISTAAFWNLECAASFEVDPTPITLPPCIRLFEASGICGNPGNAADASGKHRGQPPSPASCPVDEPSGQSSVVGAGTQRPINSGSEMKMVLQESICCCGNTRQGTGAHDGSQLKRFRNIPRPLPLST